MDKQATNPETSGLGRLNALVNNSEPVQKALGLVDHVRTSLKNRTETGQQKLAAKVAEIPTVVDEGGESSKPIVFDNLTSKGIETEAIALISAVNRIETDVRVRPEKALRISDAAILKLICNCPPSSDRTAAIKRMAANVAVTLKTLVDLESNNKINYISLADGVPNEEFNRKTMFRNIPDNNKKYDEPYTPNKPNPFTSKAPSELSRDVMMDARDIALEAVSSDQARSRMKNLVEAAKARLKDMPKSVINNEYPGLTYGQDHYDAARIVIDTIGEEFRPS